MNERAQAREAIANVLENHWFTAYGSEYNFEECFRLMELAKAKGGRLAVVEMNPAVEPVIQLKFGKARLDLVDLATAGWTKEIREEK